MQRHITLRTFSWYCPNYYSPGKGVTSCVLTELSALQNLLKDIRGQDDVRSQPS